VRILELKLEEKNKEHFKNEIILKKYKDLSKGRLTRVK
jgi:hypothetical protein